MIRRSGGFKPPASTNSATRAALQGYDPAPVVECPRRSTVRRVSQEIKQRITALVDSFDARVQATEPDAWDNVSPCDGWAARDVVALVSANLNRIGAGLVGGAPAEFDVAGDAAAQWNAARNGFAQAIAEGDLSQTMPGPMGEMSAGDLIGRIIANDVLVHTWDLARAVGGDERLDPAAVSGRFKGMKPLDEMIRRPGAFGPKVTPPAGADEQTEFLCFLGRHV